MNEYSRGAMNLINYLEAFIPESNYFTTYLYGLL